MSHSQQEEQILQRDAQILQRDAQILGHHKHDANVLRSNEPLLAGESLGQQYLGNQALGGQSLGQQYVGSQPVGGQLLQNQPMGVGQSAQSIIQRAENEIRNVESKLGGHGQLGNLQGAQYMNQGSPTRIMQGSPTRYVQGGSPTGIQKGSPYRGTGYNQSLGQFTGQGVSTGPTQQVHIHTSADYTTQAQGSPSMYQQQQQQQQFISGGQRQYSTGETIVEKIYEAPVVVTHQEQAIVQSMYEGREKIHTEEGSVYKTHQNVPIVKEIHQDVIHEHHKDVLVEHKKDILHEHHQNVIHEHVQPVIYEKHIHEHHQPIIHEKHTTLIEEKHVPIISETDTYQSNVQERQNIVTEIYEEPVKKEVFVEPVKTEVFSETIIEKQGSQYSGSNEQFISSGQGFQNQGYVSQGMQNPATKVQKTVIEETITQTNAPGGVGYVGQGTGYAGQGSGFGQQQQYLGEDQVYGQQQELDEFGRPKKQGFFKNLKSKMTGKHKEPKHL